MLGLDYLMCCSDTYHWNWFTKYCMVHRVTESIIKRTPLPKDFLLDVRSRIQEISQGEEGLHTEHENHSLFTDEEDKQALNWLQRFVLACDDCQIILIISFKILSRFRVFVDFLISYSCLLVSYFLFQSSFMFSTNDCHSIFEKFDSCFLLLSSNTGVQKF